KSDSGFELADLDLRTRQAGDVVGFRQHGLPEMLAANLLDLALTRQAKEAALRWLDTDPDLTRHAPLAAAMSGYRGVVDLDHRDRAGIRLRAALPRGPRRRAPLVARSDRRGARSRPLLHRRAVSRPRAGPGARAGRRGPTRAGGVRTSPAAAPERAHRRTRAG